MTSKHIVKNFYVCFLCERFYIFLSNNVCLYILCLVEFQQVTDGEEGEEHHHCEEREEEKHQQ